MKKSILVLGLLACLVMLVGCAKEPDSFIISESCYFVPDASKGDRIWLKDSNGKEIYYSYDLKEAKGKYKKYEGSYIRYKINDIGGYSSWFYNKCQSRIEEMINEGNYTERTDFGSKFIILNSYPAVYKDSDTTIDLKDLYNSIKIETQNSWLPGEENQVYNYQAVPDISAGFEYNLPLVGNKVRLTWHAQSDINISKLYFRLVDNSYYASWWKELNIAKQNLSDYDPFLHDSTFIVKENIKAGEVFDIDYTLPVEVNPLAQVNLCIWYNTDDATGPAVITSVK